MKFVFFGTPEYVLPILNSLHKEFKNRRGETPIVAVVTQSPKPTGRKKEVEYSAVDTWAHKKDIPVYYDAEELIKDGIVADMGIVAAYGSIISKEVLEHFKHGLLNLHFSTLPEFRGASPVHAAIITGQQEMGITIFKLDEGLDHGSIVSQFTVPIEEDDTVETLRDKGFAQCAEVLKKLLPAYEQGKITLKEQDHTKASYSKVIKKEHGFIPFELLMKVLQGETLFDQTWKIPFIYSKDKDENLIPYNLVPSASAVERFVRAMSPWPGVWTEVVTNKEQGKTRRLKILKAYVELHNDNMSLRGTKQSLSIPPSPNTVLILDEVQLEGKNPVSGKQFKEAYPQLFK